MTPQQHHERAALAAGAALAVLTLAAYLPAVLSAGWIWDDDAYITANHTLRSLDGLRRIWFEPGSVPQYYPLTFSSLWLEFQLWGTAPAGYHLTNAVLHGLGAWLAWRVLVRLSVPGAWLAAAVFALHPVHVESVAWVTERKNVLSGVFYLAAMLTYLRFTPPSSSERSEPRAYWAALLLFVAALLSKSVTASLPVVLAIVLWWRRERISKRELLPLVPLLALGAGSGLGTAVLEREHVGAIGAAWDLSFVDRCLVAGRAIWFYLGKLLWPADLTFIYPRWDIDSAALWQYAFPLAAIGALAWLFAGRARYGYGPLVAALCFGVSLSPALGFLNVYPMRYSFVADHFQYLASLAPIALCAAVVARSDRALRWIAPPLLAGLGLLAALRTSVYRDEETLWRDTIERNPSAWMAYVNLGLVVQGHGHSDEALQLFDTALRLQPHELDIVDNLAFLLVAQGKVDQALARFTEVARLAPERPSAWSNLGTTLARAGRSEQAVAAYQRALRLYPAYAEAHSGLGTVLAREGRVDEAIAHYRAAVHADPDYVDAYHNLGAALASQRHFAEAEASLREAIRLDPESPARRTLAAVLEAGRALGK